MTSVDNGNKVTNEDLDFPEHLRMIFQRMQKDETLHDVVFVVQNERFSANRCVVAAASPVLRQMLTNGMKETEAREIQLEEIKVDGWRMVLRYMYTARLDFDDIESALECLECANRFQFEELERAVADYIEKKLDRDNCYRILVVVDRINLTSLRNLVMKTICKNFYWLRFSYWSIYLPFDVILEILRSDNLVVRSELDVFMAVLRWSVCSGVSDIQPEVNSQIATRACELFAQFKLIDNDYVMQEPESCNTGSYSELFDCVNINNMSNNDLRHMVRFSRQLCAEAQKDNGVDLVHIRQLVEKCMDKLLKFGNPIPNVPITPRFRVPHGRKDEIFSFSYCFSDVQTFISPTSPISPHVSPEFVDKSGKVKWRVEVHFRGYNEETRDKYLSCLLLRNPALITKEDREKDIEFSKELFAEIVQDDGTSDLMDIPNYTSEDVTRKYSGDLVLGFPDFVPTSSLQGKDTIIVGAAIYSKPK